MKYQWIANLLLPLPAATSAATAAVATTTTSPSPSAANKNFYRNQFICYLFFHIQVHDSVDWLVAADWLAGFRVAFQLFTVFQLIYY